MRKILKNKGFHRFNRFAYMDGQREFTHHGIQRHTLNPVKHLMAYKR